MELSSKTPQVLFAVYDIIQFSIYRVYSVSCRSIASTRVQVLNTNYPLHGKSLIPVVLRVKSADHDTVTGELSRIKKGTPLESYSKEELIAEFEKLTGM